MRRFLITLIFALVGVATAAAASSSFATEQLLEDGEGIHSINIQSDQDVLALLKGQLSSSEGQSYDDQADDNKPSPASWKRWMIDSVRSASDSMEVAVDTMQSLVRESVGELSRTTQSLVAGEHALGQVRTTLPKDEREAVLKYQRERQRDRSRRGAEFRQALGKRAGGGGFFSQEENFEAYLSSTMDKEQRKNRDKKKADLVERLHNKRHHNSNLFATGSAVDQLEFAKRVVAARERTMRETEAAAASSSSSMKQQHQQQHQEQTNNRDAQVLVSSNVTMEKQFAGYRDGISSLKNGCGTNTLILARYNPNLNMSCWSNYVCTSASSPQDAEGRCFITASVFVTFSSTHRSACVPTDAPAVEKFCICQADKVAVRAFAGDSIRCLSRQPLCATKVTSPANFSEKMDDVMQNSLARGVPLRLPEVATVDRTSSAAVSVGATFNCTLQGDAPFRALGYEIIAPVRDQIGGLSPDNETLVVLLSQSSWWIESSSVTGTVSHFEEDAFFYDRELSAVAVNATQTVYPFLLSPDNFYLSNALVIMRPISFLHPSRSAGTDWKMLSSIKTRSIRNANSAKASDPTGLPSGLLVGQGSLVFSFAADNLTDDFFAGGQLTAEIALMQRPPDAVTAQLVTFDVINAPPPLPRVPATPMSTASIVLIVLGCVAAVSGIVALVVGFIRRKRLNEKKQVKALEKQRERRGKSVVFRHDDE